MTSRQTLVPVNIESATRQASRPVRSRGNQRENTAAAIRTVATLLSAGVSLERALDDSEAGRGRDAFEYLAEYRGQRENRPT